MYRGFFCVLARRYRLLQATARDTPNVPWHILLYSRRSDFWEGSYEKEMEIVAEAGDGSPSCGCYGGRGRYAGIRLYQTEKRQTDRSRK